MVLPQFNKMMQKPIKNNAKKKLNSRSHSAINFIKKNKVTKPSFIRNNRF